MGKIYKYRLGCVLENMGNPLDDSVTPSWLDYATSGRHSGHICSIFSECWIVSRIVSSHLMLEVEVNIYDPPQRWCVRWYHAKVAHIKVKVTWSPVIWGCLQGSSSCWNFHLGSDRCCSCGPGDIMVFTRHKNIDCTHLIHQRRMKCWLDQFGFEPSLLAQEVCTLPTERSHTYRLV